MEFQGRIMKVLPMRSGRRSDGSEWKAQPFVFEYHENPTDRYSDKVMLETFDERLFPQIQEGTEVRIGFGHSVRSWEGRTYNEVRMYKMEIVSAVAPQPTAKEPQPMPQAQEAAAETQSDDGDDGLPF